MKWKICDSRLKEIEEIQKLINYFSQKNLTVPVELAEIVSNLKNFVVARNGRKIIGCGQLTVYRQDVAEIRSVCVVPAYQRKGIGTAIVKTLLKKARKQKINHVVVVTKSPGFWDKIGFSTSDRHKYVRIKSVSRSEKFI